MWKRDALATMAGDLMRTDAELLDLYARTRDESAFAELVARHGGMVWRVGMRILGETHAAEDAAQATFLTLARKAHALDRGAGLVGWLHGVARREALRAQRTRRRRARREEEAGMLKANEAAVKPPDEGARAAALQALDAGLAALPAGQRQAVLLRYLEGRSEAEAARFAGCAQGTLSSQASKGLARLRERLARGGAALGAVALASVLEGEAALAMPGSLATSLVTTSKTAAARGARLAASAKGGIAMKLIAGVVLAGAVAGAAAVSMKSGRDDRGGALPAEAAPGKLAEHPHDGRYTWEPIVGARSPRKNHYFSRGCHGGILNGPGIQSDNCATDDLTADTLGNAYWTEAGGFELVRMWKAENDRVYTVAGSARGRLDGPLTRARFSAGWKGGGYWPGQITASPDGTHIFVRDGQSLRHIDLEESVVRTVGPYWSVRDKTGDVYLLDLRKGGVVPPGKGYKTLKTAALQGKFTMHAPYYALDAEKMKLYYEPRGAVSVWDLNTGQNTRLTYHSTGYKDPAKGKTVFGDQSGPFMKRMFQCPIGLSLSPGGRYLYMGGGDSSSFWRLDLEKKYIHIFGRREDGSYGFVEGKENQKHTNHSDWPGAACPTAGGVFLWSGGGSGIYRVSPVK